MRKIGPRFRSSCFRLCRLIQKLSNIAARRPLSWHGRSVASRATEISRARGLFLAASARVLSFKRSVRLQVFLSQFKRDRTRLRGERLVLLDLLRQHRIDLRGFDRIDSGPFQSNGRELMRGLRAARRHGLRGRGLRADFQAAVRPLRHRREQFV